MTAEATEFPGRPEWATDRLVDESMIEYSHAIGSVSTCGDEQDFDVVVIQRDMLDFEADPPRITRHEPEIRLAGVRISEEQARPGHGARPRRRLREGGRRAVIATHSFP